MYYLVQSIFRYSKSLSYTFFYTFFSGTAHKLSLVIDQLLDTQNLEMTVYEVTKSNPTAFCTPFVQAIISVLFFFSRCSKPVRNFREELFYFEWVGHDFMTGVLEWEGAGS